MVSPNPGVLFHVPLLCFSMSCLSKQTSAHLTLHPDTPYPVLSLWVGHFSPSPLPPSSSSCSSHLLEGTLPLASVFPSNQSLFSLPVRSGCPHPHLSEETPQCLPRAPGQRPSSCGELVLPPWIGPHPSLLQPPPAGSSQTGHSSASVVASGQLFTWGAPFFALSILGLQILLQASTLKKIFF